MNKRANPLQAGQVWVTRDGRTRTPSRRIVEVIGCKICYSTGTQNLRWCLRVQFRLWIRRYKATATRTSQPRTLVLRPLRTSIRRTASKRAQP